MPLFLRQFCTQQKRYVLTFAFVAFVTAVLIAWRGYIYSDFLDELTQSLKQGSADAFFRGLGILIITEIVLYGIRFFQFGLHVKYRGYMNIHARVRGVDRAIAMNYQHIAKLGSGRLLQIIHNGMEGYSFLIYEGLVRGIEAIVSLLAIAVVLTGSNIWFLSFFIFAGGLTWRGARFAFHRLTQTRNTDTFLNEEYTKQTAKILMNFLLLKLYNLKEKELEKLTAIGHRRVDNYMKMKLWFNAIASLANFFIIVLVLICVGYFGRQFLQGQGTLQTILLPFILLTSTRQQFYSFGLFVAELAEKITYIHRYDEIVAQGQTEEKQETGQEILSIRHTIVYDHLFYRYAGQEYFLFDDFSCTIPRGQKIALIGKSGSGKSTLLKLLTRMVEPEKGEILLTNPSPTLPLSGQGGAGEVSLTSISHESLYRRIGYFWQEPLVFDGTVAENLSLHTDISEEKLTAVLHRVDLDYLSLETVIGEHGVLLSGGEKQRIALARAFLFDYDIILLDEPTANLDEELEQKILLQIFAVYKDKTIIVVSHRPFILDYVDRILTLRKGEIMKDNVRT